MSFEDDGMVTEALRALADETRTAQAPARVEARLLAAYRQGAGGLRWVAGLRRGLFGAAAAALAAIILMAPPPERRPAPAAAAGEWYSLSYGLEPEPGEVAPVVRTRVPRTVLASFGVPVDPERATETIQADVVVGWDGRARAIRFVR